MSNIITNVVIYLKSSIIGRNIILEILILDTVPVYLSDNDNNHKLIIATIKSVEINYKFLNKQLWPYKHQYEVNSIAIVPWNARN